MFCFQCEQAAKGTGCAKIGVCGKEPEVAALQDLLVHALKGISMFAHRSRQLGVHDHEIDLFVVKALFSTVTNVNFDANKLEDLVRKAAQIKNKAEGAYKEAVIKAGNIEEELSGPAHWQPAEDIDGLVKEGEEVGIAGRRESLGEDIIELHANL